MVKAGESTPSITEFKTATMYAVHGVETQAYIERYDSSSLVLKPKLLKALGCSLGLWNYIPGRVSLRHEPVFSPIGCPDGLLNMQCCKWLIPKIAFPNSSINDIKPMNKTTCLRCVSLYEDLEHKYLGLSTVVLGWRVSRTAVTAPRIGGREAKLGTEASARGACYTADSEDVTHTLGWPMKSFPPSLSSSPKRESMQG